MAALEEQGASRRSSPASTCPRGTSTRRTSASASTTSRSASRRRKSSSARSASSSGVKPPVRAAPTDRVRRPGPALLIPGRRVVDPAAADHRRDHFDLRSSSEVDRQRVAVEHDEVGEVAGEQLPAAALVAREPRRGEDRRLERLLDGRPPARDATRRARRACAGRRRGSRPAGRAPRSARRSRSRRPRPSRAASGRRRRGRSCPPRSGRRCRGPTARG